MLTRYARGTFSVDWEDRYDFPGLRRKRVEKAQRELADSDLSRAAVVEGRERPLPH